MIKSKTRVQVLVMLGFINLGIAQEIDTLIPNGSGLSFHAGPSYIAIRDEFISAEKYSTWLPRFSEEWSRVHETYRYHLFLTYDHSNNLGNHNVSAEFSQFQLGLDFLYPVGRLYLFSSEVSVAVGPTADFYLHYRRQNIAGGGSSLFDAYSFAAMLSAGIRSDGAVMLQEGIVIHGSIRLALLSLGARMTDPNAGNESQIAFLSLFNGKRISFNIGPRFALFSSLSFGIRYQIDLLYLTAWDPLLLVADNVFATITYDI